MIGEPDEAWDWEGANEEQMRRAERRMFGSVRTQPLTDILRPTWSPRDLHISETLQAAVERWIAQDFDATVYLVGRAEKYMTMPEDQLPQLESE